MDKTQQLMKQKRRRFAVLTAVTLILALVVAVFAVKLAYRLPWRYDMTAQRLFTLSGQTEAVLDGLTDSVRIGAVYRKGSEEMMVQSLLDEYAKANDLVTVEYIDAEREPAKLARYQLDVAAVPNGTLIIQAAGRTKLVLNDTLFQTSQEEGSLFHGEREITGAIRYVTAAEMPKIYLVQGHSEANVDEKLSTLVSTLQTDAYEVAALNLTQTGGVPEDADLLLFASPKGDLTTEELGWLRDFMKTGGGIFLTVDSVLNSNEVQLPNFNALCGDFGVSITNNYVVEEDTSHFLSNNRLWLIPDMGNHDITAPIGAEKKMVVLPVVRGLGAAEYDKTTVTLTPLLASSDKSWVRVDMTQESDSRTDQDIPGPIALAYAASVSNVKWGNPAARTVVVGNGSFLYDGNIDVQGNKDLFLNAINWITGGRESQLIPSKVINADHLIIRGNDFVRLAVICVAVLPLVAFGGGLAVWLLRRNQ